MIDILKNTRKTDVNKIWDILGDKWLNVKLNPTSKKRIEGFWNTNELLSNGRLNSLINGINRINQFNIYGIQDFYFLDFNKLEVNSKNDEYKFEYKIFYKDFNEDTGLKANYIYPPKVLINNILDPIYIDDLYVGTIHYIKKSEKKIVLLLDGTIESNNNSFSGYIFLDEKNIPFIITNKINNVIYYEEIFENTSPSLNSIRIKNKFELFLNKDFVVEYFENFIKFKFKKFINFTSLTETESFFENKNTLFIPNVFYLDNFNLENFGYPIGLNNNHIELLKKTNNTIPSINEKIYKFWKLSQRPFNFKQFYRLSNLLSNMASAKTIDSPEVLYEIDSPNRIYKTAKLSSKVFGRILNSKLLPVDISSQYKLENLDFNIVELQNSNVLSLKFNDIFIINNESYLIKRIYGNNFVEVDREINAKNVLEEIKVLDGQTKREYNLNKYGFYEQQKYQTIDGVETNFADAFLSRTIPFGVKPWGSFKWGELYYEIIHHSAKLKKNEIGKEYFYGDPIEQSILLNYFPESVSVDFIQKQLAIENKEFNLSEFESFYYQKAVVVLPFLNYSYRFDLKENDLTTGWTLDSGLTTNYSETTQYRMGTTLVNAEEIGKKMFVSVNLNTNNTTHKSMFKCYVRGISGTFKIGLTNGTSFLSPGSFKTIIADITDDNIWKELCLFVDTDINGGGEIKIMIETTSVNNKLEIFGLEFYNSIPDYAENLHINKTIFNDFLGSNDFRLINLL